MGLSYVAAIVPWTKVRGAAESDTKQPRKSVKELALSLPKHAWRTITWREGTAARLRSRFARIRVRASPTRGRLGRIEETLLIEWPEGEAEPSNYWLATLDDNISFERLVDIAKMRWRIERDYQDSSRRSASGITRGADGPASTTTVHCASRSTDS
jgi:SRSO17 transposase